MIEKSASYFAAGFRGGLLDLNHTRSSSVVQIAKFVLRVPTNVTNFAITTLVFLLFQTFAEDPASSGGKCLKRNTSEDPEVVSAIVGGPNGAILFSLVTWSSGVEISLPLTRISSKEEAAQIAERVRNIPRNWNGGEFTCVSKMFDTIGQSIVPVARDRALRTVIDVSGDGPENCSNDAAVETARDGLVAQGAVINGLPILQAGDEGDDVTVAGWRVNAGRAALEGLELQAWYKSKVIGGPGSFIIAANGFHDFARAIRRKFVMEMSADWPSSLTASVPAPAKGPPTKLR
jgi:hypothetical protein